MKDGKLVVFSLLVMLLFNLNPDLACTAEPIVLPAPRQDGGRPLMATLKARKSTREFTSRSLPLQVLGELLWAGFGVNRPESGMRTAPSSHNRQEVEIYVAMQQGFFLYNGVKHLLEPIDDKDIRPLTGRQEFPGLAPVNLIYVVNFDRMPGVPRQTGIEAAAVSTGAIVQNVYLYCASEGLAAVVRGWIDRTALGQAMALGSNQYIIVAQTVGYPGEEP
jgi:nitroreductase